MAASYLGLRNLEYCSNYYSLSKCKSADDRPSPLFRLKRAGKPHLIKEFGNSVSKLGGNSMESETSEKLSNGPVSADTSQVINQLETNVGFRLSRVSRNLRHTWSSRLKTLGISPPQAAIIRGLSNYPATSLRELARLLGADPMNVKRCLDDLESLNLVQSGTKKGDRRQRTLTLTFEGQRLAKEVARLAEVHEDWLRSSIPPNELNAFLNAIDSLEKLLGVSRNS